MLMRQIKKDGGLAPEKMTTLAAVLFIPALLIFALIAKNISNWRDDIQSKINQAEIAQFVSSVYSPLSASQTSLIHSFSEMRLLLIEAENMKASYPNHSELIGSVTKEWDDGQSTLYSVHTNTDKEVRRAWISYNTMDQQDVLTKFAKKAVQLDADIKQTQKNYRRHIHSVQDQLIQDLDDARKLLDENRRPTKSKKQKIRNESLRKKIKSFNDRTTAELINFSSSIDSRLKSELRTLSKLIQISGQQGAIIRNHLYKNQDLEKPLSIIINNWKRLESKSKINLNQILYALESELIVKTLGLSAKSPAITAMNNSLLKNIPIIVGRAIKQRRIIDQSYNIKRTQ